MGVYSTDRLRAPRRGASSTTAGGGSRDDVSVSSASAVLMTEGVAMGGEGKCSSRITILVFGTSGKLSPANRDVSTLGLADISCISYSTGRRSASISEGLDASGRGLAVWDSGIMGFWDSGSIEQVHENRLCSSDVLIWWRIVAFLT